ncbi:MULTISPECIES: hypothetical protein [unclassified Leptolyngbya]|uniref:hypothetical protein n=1 Tax=unclassified Leptolyngbya TaxID=2650499 RepID=UPI001686CD75|nr:MULTISPECIES: hypothetical protein [unclassified Leptolyngbya]MBD1910326.1 hypothetical protein [Leptolyngbya sp. FACHB-8]MBD2154871.1 hypothetical protein [Leptolyngbya sp. FACHB-16]
MNRSMLSRWMSLGTVLLLGAIAPSLMASRSQDGVTARVRDDGMTLEIRANRQRITLSPNDFNVRVLNAVNCQEAQVSPEQQLAGTRFFPSVAVDAQTGNVAVAVLLQECYETQVSAVFVVDPQNSGYALYRVQAPGQTVPQDEFTTYPLNSITGLGYLNNELLIQHGDASGGEALLVYTTTNHPEGTYRGCLYTEPGEGNRLCPR